MSDELLPCPFCGGKAVTTVHHDGNAGALCWTERCTVMPISRGKTLEEAVAAWNRRAATAWPQGDEAAEQLGYALEWQLRSRTDRRWIETLTPVQLQFIRDTFRSDAAAVLARLATPESPAAKDPA